MLKAIDPKISNYKLRKPICQATTARPRSYDDFTEPMRMMRWPEDWRVLIWLVRSFQNCFLGSG